MPRLLPHLAITATALAAVASAQPAIAQPAVGEPAGMTRMVIEPRPIGDPDRDAVRLSPAAQDRLRGRITRDHLDAIRSGRWSAAERAGGDADRQRQRQLSDLGPSSQPPGLAAMADALADLGGVEGQRPGEWLVPDDAVDDVARLPQVARARRTAGAQPQNRTIPGSSSWPPSSAFDVWADSWWDAGHRGGGGPSDASSVGVAIVDGDAVMADHPGLAQQPWQRMPGTPSEPTRWGSNGPNLEGNGRVIGANHATAVASIVAMRPVAACPAAQRPQGCTPNGSLPQPFPTNEVVGAARGLSHMVDATWRTPNAGVTSELWALGQAQRSLTFAQNGERIDGPVIAGSDTPARAFNLSLGWQFNGVDYDIEDEWHDQLTLRGAMIAAAAGNNDPDGQLVAPCRAYNVLCVGAYDGGPYLDATPSDDQVASYSNRGPTPAGRRKPELVAPGGSRVANAYWRDNTSSTPASNGWDRFTSYSEEGTSFATPLVTGAAALLMGSGISDPIAVRALLVNSARDGRASPGQAMGTQTGWQRDWGYGQLALERALAQRSNLRTGQLRHGQPRFFSWTPTAANDRASVAWNQRQRLCSQMIAPSLCAQEIFGGSQRPEGWNPARDHFPRFRLTDADLLDAPAAACHDTSAASAQSRIDNLEQVRPTTGQRLLTLVARDPIDGQDVEPFAVAATKQITELSSPGLSLELAAGPQRLAAGEPGFASALVRVQSGDLPFRVLSTTLTATGGFTVEQRGADHRVAQPVAGEGYYPAWTVTPPAQGGRGTLTAVTRLEVCGVEVERRATQELEVAAPAADPTPTTPTPPREPTATTPTTIPQLPPAPPTSGPRRVAAQLKIAAARQSKTGATVVVETDGAFELNARATLTATVTPRQGKSRTIKVSRRVAVGQGRFALRLTARERRRWKTIRARLTVPQTTRTTAASARFTLTRGARGVLRISRGR